MGRSTDSLRATLRELAQSDARLYRGLQEELDDTPQATSQPPAVLEGDAPASRQELEVLAIAALWTLCKARGIKGLSKGPVEKQVDALLSHPAGPPPLRSALTVKAVKGSRASGKLAVSGRSDGKASSKPSGPELQHLEQRLDRLEQLVALIAQQVGVPDEAIERLLLPPHPPPDGAGRPSRLQRSIFAIREWRIAASALGPLPLQPPARPAPAGSGGAAAPGS